MEGEKKDNKNIFIYILLFFIFFVIIYSFYNFYYKKNFNFYVEIECNPEQETCFYRDCYLKPDICPPNGLSYYNKVTISANDFKYCSNENCKNACDNNIIKCNINKCIPSSSDSISCIGPIIVN